MSRLIFIDTETVRKEPGPATIWELALIVRDEGEPDHELVWHIRPDVSLADPQSLSIGGYYERSTAQVLPAGSGRLVHDSEEDPPTTPLDGPEIARPVAQLLSKAVIVGANAGSFDVPHLAAYLRGQGECLAADYHYLDIGSLVLGWAHGSGEAAPEPPLRLSTAITACGLDPASYTAHEGLNDARAVRDIWDMAIGWSDR